MEVKVGQVWEWTCDDVLAIVEVKKVLKNDVICIVLYREKTLTKVGGTWKTKQSKMINNPIYKYKLLRYYNSPLYKALNG